MNSYQYLDIQDMLRQNLKPSKVYQHLDTQDMLRQNLKPSTVYQASKIAAYDKIDGHSIQTYTFSADQLTVDGKEYKPRESTTGVSTVKVQQPKWVTRMMRLAALEVATWSKDSTKVGCVIATADGKIAATGYNGLLPIYDDRLLKQHTKEWKNNRIIHAERNALANTVIKNESLYMFVTLPPCLECAKSIALDGNIKAVYALAPEDEKYADRWQFTDACDLLRESGIEYREIVL